jgi:hypothetical protein
VDTLYIVNSDNVKGTVQGENVFTASDGSITGKQSVMTGLKQLATTQCETDTCICQGMNGREF